MPDRSEEFGDGALKVRSPKFRSMQQSGGRTPSYQKMSVLDNLIPNQNGTDTAGLERQKMGIQHSPIGQSTGTYDQSLWIRNSEQFSRSQSPEDEDG